MKNEEVSKKCPQCNDGFMVLKTNRNNGSSFLGCSEFPYCRYTEQTQDEIDLSIARKKLRHDNFRRNMDRYLGYLQCKSKYNERKYDDNHYYDMDADLGDPQDLFDGAF